MARPLKATVDYFPHFATSGKTMFILQSKYGNDGYAFWFKLLELLAVSEGHHYDYNNSTDWEFLLAKTHVSQDVATTIIATLASLDAIDKELAESKVIWCQNFVNNVADAYKRRQLDLPHRPEVNGKPFVPVKKQEPATKTDDILDPDLATVVQSFLDNISPRMGNHMKDELELLCEEYTIAQITKSFQLAAEQGKPTLAYAKGILRNDGKNKPFKTSSTERIQEYDFD